ncbi:hypothetical protein HYU23_03550 [Candidatus Woesearchaeota archaeon]|nr:hypothetical protein [Candidatus Woesearchaeota archaeon]
MASPLQNAITFLRDFGLFDVVLPFLLVFTLIFAILEKTKILGTEGKDQPKRSLNTMVAFVMGMLVIATNKIVTAINEALPNIVLVIVSFVAFLLMIGVFFGTEEFKLKEKYPGFTTGLVVVSFIILIIIVLDSLKVSANKSWLDWILEYVINNISGPIVTSIIFLIIAVIAIVYITRGPKSEK